ncbi:uncharacterized protein C20orf96 homolog isoform X3 [Microcaecilia unicolor]|uniref:Uncharacterized protein C20orf96 homolog isoform X3 n=1 Tax=Microcaecilia unicolor TaxID=1415580 RepID=A0A6P7YZ56_9AMPH|nr:uncharacterized protein C20orf96 homolog isoform X3 [Microcaecilia unicolor]
MEELLAADYSRWQRTEVEEPKSVIQKPFLPTIEKLLHSTSTSEIEKRRKKVLNSLQKEKDPKGLSYPRPVLTLGTCVQDNTNQKTTERVEDFTQQENNCRILQKSTMSMQQWNQQQVEMAKQDLKEAEEMVEKQLGELQRELHELDSKLQASQEKLQILRTYRDKEFPGNMLRIGQLQRELQEHKEAQQAEKDDLEKLKNTKVDKMKDKKESMLKSTPEEKTKHFPPSSMKMAAFNCIMTKEIKLHKQIIKELKKDISDLLEQQLFLVESRREVRQEKFADVLLQRPKCTPDMEIILDIPLREKTII